MEWGEKIKTPEVKAIPGITPGENKFSPLALIRIFSPDDWEDFVWEWATSLREKYVYVHRLGGAGDKGRDIVGFRQWPPVADGDWDNYQCKHYKSPLTPARAKFEIAKFLSKLYFDKRPLPARYYFVAPQGVGTTLHDLLEKPNNLKEAVLKDWGEKYNEFGKLDVNLETFIRAVDFSIFRGLPPTDLIAWHRATPYHTFRFGTSYPERPPVGGVPETPAEDEAEYIRKLIEAAADEAGKPFATVTDLVGIRRYYKYLVKAREAFYSAESLRNFSRDSLPFGVYETVLNDFDAAIELIRIDDHENGFKRLNEAVKQAINLQINYSFLTNYLENVDRIGICHQLANESDWDWVNNE